MEETLRLCEYPPNKGERKMCATSRESMDDFILSIFGTKANLQMLSTTLPDRMIESPKLHAYTVEKISNEFKTPKVVVCHLMPYLYPVFFCHDVTKAKVFEVKLKLEAGNRVNAGSCLSLGNLTM
ncbi:hypothetical protein AMTRI_Chr13g125880 [Amborella trichopoda]